MRLYIDDREPKKIIDELKDVFDDVTITRLSIGDYLYGTCLIERKSCEDFLNCLRSGLVFQQAQDLLAVHGCKSYILITCKIQDYIWLGENENTILSAIASLNVRGIPTLLIESESYFIKFIKLLMEKTNDSKMRLVNPQRKQVTMQDKLENIYSNFPGLGPGLAKKLKEKYPTVKSLSTVTIKELKEINGFGPKRARQTFNFIHGIE